MTDEGGSVRDAKRRGTARNNRVPRFLIFGCTDHRVPIK